MLKLSLSASTRAAASTTNLQHRTLAQRLSATSLKSGNLLRQHTKEPLIARYTSKSAYYNLQE
jgi:hypothetical protein